MSDSQEALPKGWIVAKLEHVCEILDSHRIPVNNKERAKRIAGKNTADLYPYYGATGQVGQIDDYLFDGEYVLIGEDGAPFLDITRDTAYIVQGRFWVNNHAHILRAYTSNKYLCYFLNQVDYSDYVTGTTRLKLNQARLKEIQIIFPPLNEQKRIVGKIEELFSELDKGIESLKTAREQLQVYRQAVLKHAFEGKLTANWREKNKDKLESVTTLLKRIVLGGKKMQPMSEEEYKKLLPLPRNWQYVRLAEIATIGSGMSVSKDRKVNDPIEVPYLRVANVQRGKLSLEEIKTMRIEKARLPELELKQWDILFNEGGDRDKLGRGWIWESQITPCITQNHVFRATTVLGLDFHAKFISYWGNSFGQAYFDTEGKQTTNLASINKRVLSSFPIPFPSLDEQAEIIRLLEAQFSIIENLESTIETELQKSEALRQSILKKAFSGQLVAQDPADEPASALLERIHAEKEAQSGKRKTKEKRRAA